MGPNKTVKRKRIPLRDGELCQRPQRLFEKLFGGLYIGENPTEERLHKLVMVYRGMDMVVCEEIPV